MTKEWEHYKAARIALGNTLDLEYIADLSKFFHEKLDECYEKCDSYLTEGTIDEEYVLDKVNFLLNIIRESNITVRWLMLHYNTEHPKAKDIVTKSQK